MNAKQLYTKRFAELDAEIPKVMTIHRDDDDDDGPTSFEFVKAHDWHRWSTSVLNLLQQAFGVDSVHYQNFRTIYDKAVSLDESDLEPAKGVFHAARIDFDSGYIVSLESLVSGEIFGDFVNLAKLALQEGSKDVAIVLACAALEDVLKRFAVRHGIDVPDRSMQEVVGALKAKGLIGGAQKSLLDVMPKIRDYAMHANWDKISPQDVNSVIGFVEQFLISNFSAPSS